MSQAGAGYVALDPSFPDSRIELVLGDSRPLVAVMEPSMAKRDYKHGICTTVEDIRVSQMEVSVWTPGIISQIASSK